MGTLNNSNMRMQTSLTNRTIPRQNGRDRESIKIHLVLASYCGLVATACRKTIKIEIDESHNEQRER